MARNLAIISADEEKLMISPRAPIVLVEKTGEMVAPSVAEGHRRLGIMLPYTPLHHLLFDKLQVRGVDALVMTSGNASDEPICLNNDEALDRLTGIADSWLLHDRDIVRRADDSVIQILDGETLFFRRSRGYAPVPVSLKIADGPDILAVGPELKNTVCLLKENRAFLSPHIGDLENLKAFEFFTETVSTLQDVLECEPQIIAHDLHPGYFSTRWAKEQSRRSVTSGTGAAPSRPSGGGHGRTRADRSGHRTDHGRHRLRDRRHHLGRGNPGRRPGGLPPRGPPRTGRPCREATRRFALPGARRSATCGTPSAASCPPLPCFAGRPVAAVVEMLDKGVNSPLTSSCGRLFDAVAALTGRWLEAEYEAQAAIELMALTTVMEVAAASSFLEKAPRGALVENTSEVFAVPIAPIVRGVVSALTAGASAAEISARFHRTLIDLFVTCAQEAAERTGIRTIVLGGGVFQNEILLSQTARLLDEAGFAVHRPVLLPPGDGAVALGQAAVVRARTKSVIRREN